MKKITLLLFLTILYPGLLLAADEAALNDEAAAVVNAYVFKLKSTLKRAMETGGPVRAIETCSLQAPAFADQVGNSIGWQVGRTSLRARNTENRPDAWEKAGLEEFERQHRQGVPASKLTLSAIVEDGAGRHFRFLKAIPTAGFCLSCHGEKIAPEVQQAIDKIYPEDQAIGYRKGDLRGAFTLRKPLQN